MRINRFSLYVSSGFSAIALALSVSSATAQEHGHDVCRNIGLGQSQPLGDREGHTVAVGDFICETTDGGLKGVVWTGTATWEWDGTKAKELYGGGVGRRPGTLNVYRDLDGEIELIMTDGKPTGWKGSTHGVNLLSTGDWAPQSNKKWTWTGHSTGLDTFEGDWVIE
jgi:hypothetical protein